MDPLPMGLIGDKSGEGSSFSPAAPFLLQICLLKGLFHAEILQVEKPLTAGIWKDERAG